MRHYAIVRIVNPWLVKIISIRDFQQAKSAVEWARRHHVDGQRLALVVAPRRITTPAGKAIRRPTDWIEVAA